MRWVAEHETTGAEARRPADVLDTPGLARAGPPAADGTLAQKTETLIGPYELHDFFLFRLLRLGAGPAKMLFLADHAFDGRYDARRVQRWLRVFVDRFFASQFKRSVSPTGPRWARSASPRAATGACRATPRWRHGSPS